MRTVIYNQGFNRVEDHQILCLERAKLNRLLAEERRVTETFIESAKREIETRPQILPSLEAMWNNIQNQRLVRDVRRRIDCLTDAYPQFSRQVAGVRARLREKANSVFEAARFAAQQAIRQNRLASSARCLVIK